MSSETVERTTPPFARPHRRYNPLTDEWVQVSAGRTKRPWLGRDEPIALPDVQTYDPTCYLCPGNRRAGDALNPRYGGTYVFENDFGALDPAASPEHWEQGMLQAEQLPGACRVLCFSPRHDLTLSGMPTSEVGAVVDLWATQTTELGSTYRWVQIFENRGALMGASNPHPHGQIWAVGALPREAQREDAAQERYARSTGRSLLVDYAAMESGGPRIVAEDDDWLAAVPFWAAWPFESILIPRHPIHRLAELSDQEREGLARSLRSLLNRYDRLFDRPFPYSMGWHQAPFVREAIEHWQLHAHIYPPLLRPTVRKFMVGYELLAEPQRDLTPEDAADQLRAVEVLSEVSATALNQTPGRQGGSARRPVDPETHPHSTVK